MTLFSRLLLATGLFCGSLSLGAQAQTLPTHSIRSNSPTDTSFADLEFLTQEIGAARVVMLGEPTHGEGNVTEAKIRLIRFLQQRMGFTTVAFESGFYELNKAQRQLEAGTPPLEAIGNSVFAVWTGTQEFQSLLPLLGKGKDKLKVAGFDNQLSGDYQEDMLEELEALLKPQKGASGIAYDYLEACISSMGENFIFPPTHQLALFELQLGKVRRLLEKVAASPDAKRREQAAFWLQNLRSLQATARNYATIDPTSIDSSAWRAATHSNPRDAQMADNLLWYVRQHPQEKVLCWGAVGHFANKVEVLRNAELQDYRPMGRAVKAALGNDAVYILGTLAGGGTHRFGAWGQLEKVPAPAPGTLEAELLASGQEYAYVSLKHAAPGRVLTTYAFEYKALSGPWSEVVDGFLYLKTVNPPHPVGLASAATVPDSSRSNLLLNSINPARRLRVAKASTAASGGARRRGVVLDAKTGAPVPFATVAVPGRALGTVSDAQGKFGLAMRAGEAVQVSSIGYEMATLAAPGGGELAVRLVPAAYALANVRVSAASQNPKKIMQRVIKAADANYEQADYAAQVYTHRSLINFDTLRHEVEYVSQVFEPAGYRHWGGGFMALGDQEKHRIQEARVVVESPRPLGPFELLEGGQGFVTASSDPVRISPLFKKKKVGKFNLQLDSIVRQGDDGLYVIRFSVKRATRRSTGTTLQSGYAGKVYIRQQDYAVVRYEALWTADTVYQNAVAHKYYGRKNDIANLYSSVCSDGRAAHVVTYQKGNNGRYQVATSRAQGVSVGRVLGGKPFHTQKVCEEYFTSLPAGTVPLPPNPAIEPRFAGNEMYQLQFVPYSPDFWQTYQRPTAAEAAPELRATKP
ncbi:erythromycin esterase family protein [Hymenobacter elongatus]|uniref:Erythromycin esterase family protein n=1 Tax=Hymenobacter elongatus TaxID=877208 RepID=A0A4Z0PHQ8_9BACT|nr:erythromycin esterase family protein [Hymenobacter elongatus]TGE13089.1 hypothetical protein E5J99_19640 [Hymenobacter elongatus]